MAMPGALFPRLLLALGEREALRLFPACPAFLNVVSALAVSHGSNTLPLTSNIKHQKFSRALTLLSRRKNS